MKKLKNINRVLVIRAGALGDLVYSLSVIEALQKEYGQSVQIDFVCSSGLTSIFDNDKRVGRIFPIKHKKFPILLSSQKKEVIKFSKNRAYDLLINLEGSKYFHKLALAINARYKTGFFFLPPPSKEHTTNAHSQQVHAVVGLKGAYALHVKSKNLDSSFPKLYGTPKSEVFKKYNLPEKYIVINPSNSHNKKEKINYRAWAKENWIELIKTIDKSVKLVVIAGRGEEKYFETMRPYFKNCIDLIAKTSLPDLIGVIENAEAIITTDTGPAHIASAVNTPTFVLIGPTPAGGTGPFQSPTNEINVISLNLECSPCYGSKRMYECKDNVCMSGITPSSVIDILKTKGHI
ncbi:MAG: glycosyltransferase family 9 protein [Campylobacterota bacterium]|nr:glycosyltransferase family 9 protein [Campylobacterota bacterium]